MNIVYFLIACFAALNIALGYALLMEVRINRELDNIKGRMNRMFDAYLERLSDLTESEDCNEDIENR